MKERVILHSDANCFYASVELLHHPELAGKPIAVGGDQEARHGIVLTASYEAKRCGVKTGMAFWQAKQMCPEITILPARMDLYLRFSRMAQEIYADYTDLIQPYGIDESWLDVTESAAIKGDGMVIAQEISDRFKKELGLTVSIGVSWNKIFAKLGSDYKKPDAITRIDKMNYKKIVWNLPVEDLLYVGRSTKKKLNKLGIRKIGELAMADEKLLQVHLGKMGLILKAFANGWDDSAVMKINTASPIKSIGNSTTAPRDIENEEEARIILYALSESVAIRLRENGFKCSIVEISLRSTDLHGFTRQHKLQGITDITSEIAEEACRLLHENYDGKSLRSVGVRAAGLVANTSPEQLNLFMDPLKKEKMRKLDSAVDDIRRRFGFFSLQRGLMMQDKVLSNVNGLEHTIHPHGYFG